MVSCRSELHEPESIQPESHQLESGQPESYQHEAHQPEEVHTMKQGMLSARCASLDGDADRLVYFTQQDGTFQLFDGDRIAVLAALLVRDILNDLPLPADSIKVSLYRINTACLQALVYVCVCVYFKPGPVYSRCRAGQSFKHQSIVSEHVVQLLDVVCHGETLLQLN